MELAGEQPPLVLLASSTARILGFAEALAIAFCADVFDGFVDHVLQFAGRNVGESGVGLLNGVMEDPPADGFLAEL